MAESKNKIDLSSSTSFNEVVAKKEEIAATAAAAKTDNENNDEEEQGQAATGTVNERLIAELQAAEEKEKYGARSSMGKKMGFDAFRSSKTDEERQAAIDEARNLNGVNPLVTFVGSVFALSVSYGLWAATTFLAVWFVQHTPETDVFFVQRSTAVFRNVVMGLVSLASGFFGVTGLGILLLTFKVTAGVAKGELDPTPIVNNKMDNKQQEFEMGNAWDLMLNKKPSRKRREDINNNGNGPFGT
eukprot:CAMPEP_0198147834 /NCGR_PEP_ID=MMETSP1443-20131203/38011_1 /TAXON_ID=186043 /ORGANISM="Entomoneis sp., Strain CCMP2396" /LENGTH=243 /DNA_ID=CAMNT_0043812327 /DNA_START=206 /DNA_END=937 /DNA_ORIENTATION=+